MRPWWLATNSTGQTYVYYDKPTLQESGYWSCNDNTTSFLVAEFDVDDDFDVAASLLDFQYN